MLENARSPRPGRPRPATTALLAILILAVQGVSVEAAAGRGEAAAGRGEAQQQQTHQRIVRHVEMSPRIGPPGTAVTLSSRLLPAMTPLQLSIGGTRSGFEALALAQTSVDGELEEIVEVPPWTKRDVPHRFIIFNLYFSTVLAESGIFHVTDDAGRVVRQGAIGSSGADCPTLEGDDGERYRLIGSTDGRGVGDQVVVEGALRESESGCGEDLSLNLEIVTIG